MSLDKKDDVYDETTTVDTTDEDDKELVALGYKPSFKREFTNLATVRSQHFVSAGCRSNCCSCIQISFAFSIMVCSAQGLDSGFHFDTGAGLVLQYLDNLQHPSQSRRSC
jgi:hypothetical protein